MNIIPGVPIYFLKNGGLRNASHRLYAVSCGTQHSQFGMAAATYPPAFPASGKGASRPLPSGLSAKKTKADNPLTSVGRVAAASRPCPTGGLRPALTRPRPVVHPACGPQMRVSLSTLNDEGPSHHRRQKAERGTSGAFFCTSACDC